VTVTATGGNETVSDFDDATVTLTDVLPVITVVKTADPLTLPEPGGTFTFTVEITNDSTEDVTIGEIVDDVYDDVDEAGNDDSTCDELIGDTLASGASVTCSFQGDFFGEDGDDQTDTVNVTVADDDENTATASDDATVTLVGGPGGSITIDKVAEGAYRVFHFRYVFDGTTEEFRLGDGDSTMFEGLDADEYVIREIEPDGWFLEDLTCNPGSDVEIDLEELTVTVNLRPGEDVTCTFVNEPGSGTSPQLPIQQPGTVVDQQQQPRILGDNIQAPSANPQVADPASADPAIDGLVELPRTGVSTVKLTIMALLMIVLGLTLVAEQRRKDAVATAERPVR
ncbi:MAG: prealbumin-like fold domain-containing protein, partial [Actinomycetota bacterium]